jgi:hypothetical protein
MLREGYRQCRTGGGLRCRCSANADFFGPARRRGGVPFGIEDVNVPLWGNYAALMDPFWRLLPWRVMTGGACRMRSRLTSGAAASPSLRWANDAGSGWPTWLPALRRRARIRPRPRRGPIRTTGSPSQGSPARLPWGRARSSVRESASTSRSGRGSGPTCPAAESSAACSGTRRSGSEASGRAGLSPAGRSSRRGGLMGLVCEPS